MSCVSDTELMSYKLIMANSYTITIYFPLFPTPCVCVCVFCHQFSLFNWIEMNWNVSSTKCLLGQLCCSSYFIIAIYAMFDVRHFIALSNYNSLLLSHLLRSCAQSWICVFTRHILWDYMRFIDVFILLKFIIFVLVVKMIEKQKIKSFRCVAWSVACRSWVSNCVYIIRMKSSFGWVNAFMYVSISLINF